MRKNVQIGTQGQQSATRHVAVNCCVWLVAWIENSEMSRRLAVAEMHGTTGMNSLGLSSLARLPLQHGGMNTKKNQDAGKSVLHGDCASGHKFDVMMTSIFK